MVVYRPDTNSVVGHGVVEGEPRKVYQQSHGPPGDVRPRWRGSGLGVPSGWYVPPIDTMKAFLPRSLLTPRSDDRGGKDADYKNYVTLLQEMRASFTKRNEIWGISMAIPASYWYLQHFDISALEKEVNWFNLMR